MRIVISGASGLIGRALGKALSGAGNEVTILSRKSAAASSAHSVPWNPYASDNELACDPRLLDGQEAFIHLSGESVAGGRWTEARKKLLRESRVRSTGNLVRLLAQIKPAPRTFVCASAIGYYGDRAEEVLTEDSAPGTGFLPDLCQEWERSAQVAKSLGVRVVHLRFGIVLSSEGGALGKMLPIFRLGVAGKLGSGKQYMSWIAMPDAVQAILHILKTDRLQGPVNITAPRPVTNTEFTKTLGRVLHRPAILPAPAFGLRLVLGEMADALLASTRAVPRRLLDSQFEFKYPELQIALQSLL